MKKKWESNNFPMVINMRVNIKMVNFMEEGAYITARWATYMKVT